MTCVSQRFEFLLNEMAPMRVVPGTLSNRGASLPSQPFTSLFTSNVESLDGDEPRLGGFFSLSTIGILARLSRCIASWARVMSALGGSPGSGSLGINLYIFPNVSLRRGGGGGADC